MNAQPQWQKAKVIKAGSYFPHLLGKRIWVRNQPPEIMPSLGFDDVIIPISPKIITILQGWNTSIEVVGDIENFELLPEFSNEQLDLVPFSVWSQPDWLGV